LFKIIIFGLFKFGPTCNECRVLFCVGMHNAILSPDKNEVNVFYNWKSVRSTVVLSTATYVHGPSGIYARKHALPLARLTCQPDMNFARFPDTGLGRC
jgi:hypothetical protein